MAWTHVREPAPTVANITAGTTTVLTIGAAGAQAGDTLVLIVALDNAGTSGAAPTLSIADTGGNSWAVRNVSLRDPGLVNEGTACYEADALIVTPLVSGNTITLTWSVSVTAKAVSIREFSGGAQSTVAANRLAGQNGTNGVGTAPTAGLNPATLTDYLMIGAVAVEGGTADTFTQDADTTNGVWVGFTRAGAGTTTSGQTINGAYKIVTANGLQTYNPTLGTSRDWAEKMVALRAAIDLASADANGSSTATGDLTVTSGGAAVALEAASGNGTSSTTAALTVDRGLAATSGNGTSSATGALSVAVSLAATSANGTSSTTADVTVDRGLSATSGVGSSTATGDLTVTAGGAQVDLQGQADGLSSATAALAVGVGLAATSAGLSTASGTLGVVGIQQLAGTSQGSSSASGVLTVDAGDLKVGYIMTLNPDTDMWGRPRRHQPFVLIKSPED